MVPRYELTIDVVNCNINLTNTTYITDFLKGLPGLLGSKMLQLPVAILRTDEPKGVTAVLVNHSSHVAIHTFPYLKEATIDIYSYHHFRDNEVKSQILDFFQVTARDLRIAKNSNTKEEFLECEVSPCTTKATKEWGGLNVCRDHYEKFKDEHFDNIHEMDEY